MCVYNHIFTTFQAKTSAVGTEWTCALHVRFEREAEAKFLSEYANRERHQSGNISVEIFNSRC